ncbi:MAG: 4-hydroxy-tetrahydrodipicolinate reductase [Desulfobacterales bacterium]|jgi:4-hydroxy-tetrahydrodipicolinate reductase|nr:4-hydroxy-tetrahydrodipicolinate reductase [Desulfobacterales bacterium]
MVNVAMLGASGRMGRTIVPLLYEAGDLRLSGALAAAEDNAVGQDAGVISGMAAVGVVVSRDPAQALAGAEVAIDFTLPAASIANARLCAERGCAMVIGTTGHDSIQRAKLEALATRIPVVLAPNMSLGVNLLFKLAELAARALDEQYDIEVFEAHHRNKVDAPSGTALGLARAAAQGRGRALEDVAEYARHGQTGIRERGRIGFSVVRGGDIVGEHRLIFAGPGEQVELAHTAQDRSSFARGAVAAARWVAGRTPGLYSMGDVLGL